MPQNAPFSNNFSPIISDGSVATPNVTELVLAGGAVVIASGGLGGGKSATYTPDSAPTATIEFTDGTHTVSAATQLTVTGGTIGGSGADATLLIPNPITSHGTVTLNGATPVTVTDAAITANSVPVFALKTVGGTVGSYPTIETITPTTGFTVAGEALDTSTYNYVVFN